jgi:hypothetical protein
MVLPLLQRAEKLSFHFLLSIALFVSLHYHRLINLSTLSVPLFRLVHVKQINMLPYLFGSPKKKDASSSASVASAASSARDDGSTRDDSSVGSMFSTSSNSGITYVDISDNRTLAKQLEDHKQFVHQQRGGKPLTIWPIHDEIKDMTNARHTFFYANTLEYLKNGRQWKNPDHQTYVVGGKKVKLPPDSSDIRFAKYGTIQKDDGVRTAL